MRPETPHGTQVEQKPPSPWQLKLRRFFHQAWVEISIGGLVIVSVLLTLLEFWLEAQLQSGHVQTPRWLASIFGPLNSTHLFWMVVLNEFITVIFVVELSLRYIAASSKRWFFREFWLDILATLPLFRVFRFARALRLLRLIRLLRLFGVISRLSTHFPYVFRQGAVDFVMICGLLLLAVTFGTLAIMHFESEPARRRGTAATTISVADANSSADVASNGELADGANVDLRSGEALNLDRDLNLDDDEPQFGLDESFWFSVYTLFAGEPVPRTPKTISGKIVSVFLMFMGLTIFAIFAGTVSAFMVDRMRVEGRIVEWDALQDHIVICGWTPKTRIIIDEYRASLKTRKTPIVVITELDSDQLGDARTTWSNVHFIHDDFTRVTALERSGVRNAKTCLVLTDTHGGRSEQDADARTILAALTVEKINESVYTCAELVNRNYATHLEAGKVNDFVVSGEYGAHMLAQAAMNRGLIGVLGELLTYQRGNEFYRLPVPDAWIGESFDDKLSDIRKTTRAILVAVHPVGATAMVNPKDYRFQALDEVVLISDEVPKLS